MEKTIESAPRSGTRAWVIEAAAATVLRSTANKSRKNQNGRISVLAIALHWYSYGHGTHLVGLGDEPIFLRSQSAPCAGTFMGTSEIS